MIYGRKDGMCRYIRPSFLRYLQGRWRLSDEERRRQEAEALRISLPFMSQRDGLPGNRRSEKVGMKEMKLEAKQEIAKNTYN